MEDVIKVFTGRSLETMFNEGGIGHWQLDLDRASACLYVVGVRNINGEAGVEGVEHRTAFMIGKVSDILESGDRFVIAFSEYATLDIPNAWGTSGNPVAYTNLEKLEIDPKTLKWRKFPTPHRSTV